jgi:hypothetical protein
LSIGTGQVLLVSVKNEDKLRLLMQAAAKRIVKEIGTDVRIRVRDIHGVGIHEFVSEQSPLVCPSYVIANGWLAISLYPQPLQGFILRSQGKLPAWRPDSRTAALLANRPADAVGIEYSDAVASVRQFMNTAPLWVGYFGAGELSAESAFDIGSIPNPHEAAEHLFPNLMWIRRNDKSISFDSHASFGLPVEFIGPESLLLFGLDGKFILK